MIGNAIIATDTTTSSWSLSSLLPSPRITSSKTTLMRSGLIRPMAEMIKIRTPTKATLPL